MIAELSAVPLTAGAYQRRGDRYAIRNLLREAPALRLFAESALVRNLIEPVVGPGGGVVRAILFDKTADTNWTVAWHQDTTIAVAERSHVAGFGPWSVKAGVTHVRPPAHVLERMVTLRLHLDDCGADNGPLMVIPGSHRGGIRSDAEIASAVTDATERGAVQAILSLAGGILLMRPLLLHASRPALRPGHRRVVHMEFASGELPGGLRWHFE